MNQPPDIENGLTGNDPSLRLPYYTKLNGRAHRSTDFCGKPSIELVELQTAKHASSETVSKVELDFQN